jgi:hypothetical protein
MTWWRSSRLRRAEPSWRPSRLASPVFKPILALAHRLGALAVALQVPRDPSPGPILTSIFGKGPAWTRGSGSYRGGARTGLSGGIGETPADPARGVADYVAPVVVGLASDASSFVTGQEIAVDGGISAGRPASVAQAERVLLGKAFQEILL